MTNKQVATLVITSVLFSLTWLLTVLQAIMLILNPEDWGRLVVMATCALIASAVCIPILCRLRSATKEADNGKTT